MKKFTLLILLTACFLLLEPASANEDCKQCTQKEGLVAFFEQTGTKTADREMYTKWQYILSKYLVTSEGQPNLFRYSAVTKEDQNLLSEYINEIERFNLSLYNSNTQKAFWINLYNAVTIETVLDHYPVKSIRRINISPGFFTIGPWDKKVVNIANVPLSLNNIEHDIIRTIWNDHRIHYLVNCASLGCPDLWAHPITSWNIEDTLSKAEYSFINDPRGIQVTRNGISISKIYKWYKNDFISPETNIIDYLGRYIEKPLLNKLMKKNIRIKSHYDWSLNDFK